MMDEPDTEAAARLAHAAAQAARLRREVAADATLRDAVGAVKHFQAARLAATHGDLLDDVRYARAARFFLDDLYGTKDFSRRDVELARIIPTLARCLPESGVRTVADAVELDALSETLDLAVARALRPGASRPLRDAEYAAAYLAADQAADRERQIALIEDIGRALDRLVRVRMIAALLPPMGVAARAAGLGTMHEFLVRGFNAFRAMGGANEFLARIATRERALMREWLAGRVPDPRLGR